MIIERIENKTGAVGSRSEMPKKKIWWWFYLRARICKFCDFSFFAKCHKNIFGIFFELFCFCKKIICFPLVLSRVHQATARWLLIRKKDLNDKIERSKIHTEYWMKKFPSLSLSFHFSFIELFFFCQFCFLLDL